LDVTDLAVAKEFFADFYALEPVLDVTAVHSYAAQNSFMDPMMVSHVVTIQLTLAAWPSFVHDGL
jgi:hypothetical protein